MNDAYAKLGYTELEPILAQLDVPFTSAMPIEDRRLALEEKLAEHREALDLHLNCEALEKELRDEIDGLKDDVASEERVTNEQKEEIEKLKLTIADRDITIARFEEATSLVDTVNLMADLDAARDKLSKLQAKHASLVALVAAKAPRTLEAWKSGATIAKSDRKGRKAKRK